MRYQETLDFWPSSIINAHPNLSALELKKLYKISNIGPKNLTFWIERKWPNPEEAQKNWIIQNQPTKEELTNYLIERALKDFEPNLFNKLLDLADLSQSLSQINTNIKKHLNLPKCGKFTLQYWIARGWSEEEAQQFANTYKLDKKDKTPLTEKFWIDKGLTPQQAAQKLDSMRPTQIGYWMEKGLNYLQAALKVSEYQSERARKKL